MTGWRSPDGGPEDAGGPPRARVPYGTGGQWGIRGADEVGLPPRLARPPRRRRRPPALPLLGILLVLVAGAVLGFRLSGGPAPKPCQSSFLPAFFSPQEWQHAEAGGVSPSVIILNPASGPGTAPDPAFRAAVRHATAAGTRVLGYIGTEYGQRPLAQAEAGVRDYRRWYGVTGIFLDQSPTSGTAQLGYYRELARYVHQLSPGAPIWLNPGVYPSRAYMSVGSVVMVFEGSFASYQDVRVPLWARQYPASRFAHTIYATPQSDLAQAVRLSRARDAGHLFVTADAGANPYSAVPSYWPRELAAIAAGCSRT